MKQESIENILKAYEDFATLKKLKRQGWKEWNVKDKELESVAEHVFGTQMLAWTIIEQENLEIDANKVMAMLSLHETEEIRIGDITPFDGITKDQKRELGKEAVQKVLSNLSQSKHMKDLIEEFEEEKTKEAKFAKLCDKLECDLQARAYQMEGKLKWSQVPAKILQDQRVQRIRKNGAKTIDQIFLENDYPLYQGTIFQEIADFLKKEQREKRKVAVVLEGGALRGVYTSGVLDAFLENKIPVDCLVRSFSGCVERNEFCFKTKRKRSTN